MKKTGPFPQFSLGPTHFLLQDLVSSRKSIPSKDAPPLPPALSFFVKAVTQNYQKLSGLKKQVYTSQFRRLDAMTKVDRVDSPHSHEGG